MDERRERLQFLLSLGQFKPDAIAIRNVFL
jgi:hypothetical protein